MPRRKSAAYMSAGEQIAGTVLFVIYLLVLPFVTTPLFRLIGGLLGVTISTGLQNILYYYILFAATVIIFHGFLGRTSRHFAENLGGACKFMAIGLVALYGLNELVYRLTRLVVSNQTNLNDTTISAQIDHLEEITKKIIAYVVEHPQKLSQIRKFMNYYLPTTLKLLGSYQRLSAQNVKGENITSTLFNIAGMMHTVADAFEKQLDSLYAEEAMDISADITVFETLLKQEGFVDEDKQEQEEAKK